MKSQYSVKDFQLKVGKFVEKDPEEWYCESCGKAHKDGFWMSRSAPGEDYQLWRGPHMIGHGDSAQGLIDAINHLKAEVWIK